MSSDPLQNLERAAATFRERNAQYGDSWRRFGTVAAALFPDGVTIRTEADWARWGVLFHVIDKLSRYAGAPHRDSAHDLINYAAMLEALTNDVGSG